MVQIMTTALGGNLNPACRGAALRPAGRRGAGLRRGEERARRRGPLLYWTAVL